jgi:nucleotide-binding universal stress UspA family protein
VALSSSPVAAPLPLGFGQLVCVVDGSTAASEAVHQCTQLGGPDDTLALVALAVAPGMDGAGAAEVVGAAASSARADVVRVTTRVIHAETVKDALREASLGAGLFAVGVSESRPMPSIPVATFLAARSRAEVAFPGAVLVGSRGAPDDEAVTVAASIAAHFGTQVFLAHVGRSNPELSHALAEQAVQVVAITGGIPVVVSVDGSPADRLPDMAGNVGAGLLVLGSGGVSESMAREAACSVLVLRRTTRRSRIVTSH